MTGWRPDWDTNEGPSAEERLAETLGRLFHTAYMAALGAVAAIAGKRHYDQTGDLGVAVKEGGKSAVRWLLWGGLVFWSGFYLLSGLTLPFLYLMNYRQEQDAAARVTGYELTQAAAVQHGHWASVVIAYAVYVAMVLILVLPFCVGALYVRHIDSSLFKRRRLYRWCAPFAASVRRWPSWALYVSGFFGPGAAFGLTAAVVKQIIH